MKFMSLILLIIFVIAAGCRKELTSRSGIIGTWVEKENRLDTLVVYQSGNKVMMFDKSEYDRMIARGMAPSNTHFRYQVLLKKDSIGFRAADAGRFEPFFYYAFQWIDRKKEFRMSYNGLRPYLSSIGSNNWVILN